APKRPDPEVGLAVFVQTDCTGARTTVVTVALDAALPNRADRPRRREPENPNRALTVLEERREISSLQLLVVGDLSVLPACEPSIGPDPQRPVARSQETANTARGQ